MKAKRLLFLVMAICLASGVRAQFYDGPDDIFFYLECDENGKIKDNDSSAEVVIFNFDGQKACCWHNRVFEVKNNLKNNPVYYEDKVETTEYQWRYLSNNTYRYIHIDKEDAYQNYIFSYDRNKVTFQNYFVHVYGIYKDKKEIVDNRRTYKRVDKSFFRVGRSRTPSGTIYE